MIRATLVLAVLIALLGGCQWSPPDTAATDGRSSALYQTTCESPRREQHPSPTDVFGSIVLTAALVASLPVAIPLYICMAVTGNLPKC
jgi:hypothetical protein